jgi:hypothetical protein
VRVPPPPTYRYPMFDKIDVNGPGATELFEYLRRETMSGQDISWNYHKWVVDGETGKVVAHFPPNGTRPRVPAPLIGSMSAGVCVCERERERRRTSPPPPLAVSPSSEPVVSLLEKLMAKNDEQKPLCNCACPDEPHQTVEDSAVGAQVDDEVPLKMIQRTFMCGGACEACDCEGCAAPYPYM